MAWKDTWHDMHAKIHHNGASIYIWMLSCCCCRRLLACQHTYRQTDSPLCKKQIDMNASRMNDDILYILYINNTTDVATLPRQLTIIYLFDSEKARKLWTWARRNSSTKSSSLLALWQRNDVVKIGPSKTKKDPRVTQCWLPSLTDTSMRDHTRQIYT